VFAPVVKTVAGTALLDITELGSYDGLVLGVYGDGSRLVTVTDKDVWLDGVRVGMTPPRGIGFTPRNSRVVSLSVSGRQVDLYNVTDRQTVPFLLQAEEAASYDGRIYLRTQDRVFEVILTDAGSQVIATTKEVAQTLPFASRLYPGVVIQKLLGATYVSLLIRSGAAQQIPVKELDAYRIVDARFDHGVLMVIGEKSGRYDRLVIRFDDAGAYDVRVVRGVPLTGLNFVTLDSGVCVCLNEDEKLEIFSSRKDSPAIKYVEDKALSGDMQLSRNGGTLLVSRGNKVYKMRMK